MDITIPLYNSTDTTGNSAFNVEFYKIYDNTSLTLAKAVQLFVAKSGFNVIEAYNYLNGTIYSTADIAARYFSSQNITTGSIVCNSIICPTLVKKESFQPLLFITGLSIPISKSYIDNTYIQGLDIIVLLNANNSSCLLASGQKLIIYSTSGLALYFLSNNLATYQYFSIPTFVNAKFIRTNIL